MIEKSLRTFKMKASFVEENVPGQCNWDGTPVLFTFRQHFEENMFTKGLRRTTLELSMNVKGLISSSFKEIGVSRSWESDENIVSKRLIRDKFPF